MSVGSETKKLVVSTCRSIVKIEIHLHKLDAKSKALEQHRLNGTVPKDLLLPKKKALFEDNQSQVDGILQTSMNTLLSLRIQENVGKQVSEGFPRRRLLTTLQSSREAQLNNKAPLSKVTRVRVKPVTARLAYMESEEEIYDYFQTKVDEGKGTTLEACQQFMQQHTHSNSRTPKKIQDSSATLNI